MLNTFILNGNIYICGGNNNSSATSETIMYEVSSNTLIAKANMNIARERHAATADKYYGYVLQDTQQAQSRLPLKSMIL